MKSKTGFKITTFDDLIVSCRVFDGYEYSSWVNSSLFTVDEDYGVAPVISNVEIFITYLFYR